MAPTPYFREVGKATSWWASDWQVPSTWKQCHYRMSKLQASLRHHPCPSDGIKTPPCEASTYSSPYPGSWQEENRLVTRRNQNQHHSNYLGKKDASNSGGGGSIPFSSQPVCCAPGGLEIWLAWAPGPCAGKRAKRQRGKWRYTNIFWREASQCCWLDWNKLLHWEAIVSFSSLAALPRLFCFVWWKRERSVMVWSHPLECLCHDPSSFLQWKAFLLSCFFMQFLSAAARTRLSDFVKSS